MLLLNPGPVTLTERVRRSLTQPDLCHRESEFYDLQDAARSGLLAVYGLDPAVWSAVLMTASGTAAVESMLAALVPRSGRVLIVENGVYGERMAQICAQYQIEHERLIGDWLRAPDLDAVAQRLAAHTFTHLAVVHHETTTGRLNALEPLAALCRTRGVRMLVDGVSSFGAEPIDFDDEALAAVAATANKCLHGVPGASFVLVRRTALQQAVSRTYYLDMTRLLRLQEERGTPFTPAVHVYYALVEALREHAEEGGRPARQRRYAALAERARGGLSSLRIEPVISPLESSVVLRAYHLPAGISYAILHDRLKQDGFVIYAGQGDLAKSLFRISTMGDLVLKDIDRLIDCCGRAIRGGA